MNAVKECAENRVVLLESLVKEFMARSGLKIEQIELVEEFVPNGVRWYFRERGTHEPSLVGAIPNWQVWQYIHKSELAKHAQVQPPVQPAQTTEKPMSAQVETPLLPDAVRQFQIAFSSVIPPDDDDDDDEPDTVDEPIFCPRSE